jgi:hypothetical protein
VRHAVLVGPNSGYGEDNGYLLDSLAADPGRFRGFAVVPTGLGRAYLARLRVAGILRVTLNAALLGVAHYAGAGPQLAALAELDMDPGFQELLRRGRQGRAVVKLSGLYRFSQPSSGTPRCASTSRNARTAPSDNRSARRCRSRERGGWCYQAWCYQAMPV